MDQIQEFFSNLTTFQMLLIGAAGLLLWPTVSKLFQKDEDLLTPLPNPKPKPEVKPDPQPEKDSKDYDLTSLVYKWETFSDACHEHGLHSACEELKSVFPMLVKPYEKDHDPRPPVPPVE